MIQKDSPYETVINFEWLYGKLEPGRYQIVKTVMDFRGTGDYTNYVLAAEFDISMEEAESYFTGQKAVEDAVEIIQRRTLDKQVIAVLLV